MKLYTIPIKYADLASNKRERLQQLWDEADKVKAIMQEMMDQLE